MKEQAGGDAGRERNAEAGGKDQALGPVAPFGEQDSAEETEPRQHRRQDRGDGEFDDERDEQELLAAEGLRDFVLHRDQ